MSPSNKRHTRAAEVNTELLHRGYSELFTLAAARLAANEPKPPATEPAK